MEDFNMDRKMKLTQIKNNLIIQFNKSKVDVFFMQSSNSIDNETLFTICLPSLIKNIEERDINDQILIAILLYQIKKFINLYKDNMMNVNEKLDIKFFDSLRYISANIIYSKFNNNRLLMRFGEEGRKFYLLLKGEVAILIPIKKKSNITINEYKRYIALLIIYKEFKLLMDVLNENKSVYDMELDFLNDISNYTNNINLLQSIKLNVTEKEMQQMEKHIKILIQLLNLYLTNEEKKFYNKYVYNKQGKYQEEYDDGIFLSVREYTNRINQYSEFDFDALNIKLENIKKIEEIKKNEEEGTLLVSRRSSYNNINLNDKKSFLIYEYHKVTELSSGEMFGDLALSSSNSLRTATIITISESHFGFLTEEKYSQSIKEYNEKNRKNMICYLCNIQLLSSFTYKTIEKKFFNNFVFKGAKRNEIILSPHQKNPNIIFFKEGTFEISLRGSIIDIFNLINFYYKKFEKLAIKKNDIDEEIIHNVYLMNKQNGKIERLFFNHLNEEYEIKIFIVNAPNIFGMGPTEKEEYEMHIVKGKKVLKTVYSSFFEIKCNSMLCEYVLLDKNLFDKEIKGNDKLIRIKSHIFLREFYSKLIKRLLVLRYGKIWNLFIQNGINDEQNGVNIDWSKIELNQDFIKGINKLIESVNECKFLSNDVDKKLKNYFEIKRQRTIEEKQQLKNICEKKYSYNRIKELLNLKYNNEMENSKYKELIPNKTEKMNCIMPNIKKDHFSNSKEKKKGKKTFNSIYKNKRIEDYKNIQKSNSCMSIDGSTPNNEMKLSSFTGIFNKDDLKKLNIAFKNKYQRFTSEGKLYKKEKLKKITFYSPKLKSIGSNNNLKLHLNLYNTFKIFGETYSRNVIINKKKVKI